ncbi:MAG: DUF3833 family protein [Rhizobiaceae bacterium]
MYALIVRSLDLIAASLASVAATPTLAKEPFTFEDYYRGYIMAYGQFQSIAGLDRRFSVDLYGTWNGRHLNLVEKFKYDDGERAEKIWYSTKTGPGRYGARRAVAPAVPKARIHGNVARYAYPVYLDTKNRKNRVFFHDELVKLKDGTIHNTATVFKFLLRVANVQANFAKQRDIRILKRP